MIQTRSYDGVPVSGSLLAAAYTDSEAPEAKIQRLTKSGEYIRLRRNLYVDTLSGPIQPFLAANYIVHPSYVSGLSALWYYDIIPEFVYDIISMTTRRSVSYQNRLGVFNFVSCPEKYFPIGVRLEKREKYSFLIAGMEKALCDHILMTPRLNLRYVTETRIWMEEDMRMDMDILSGMDLDIIRICAREGRKETMLNNIIKIFS